VLFHWRLGGAHVEGWYAPDISQDPQSALSGFSQQVAVVLVHDTAPAGERGRPTEH
jgi:hypothetical protein